MIGILNFEYLLLKVIKESARPDLLETEFNGRDEIWVGSIYLDDHEESIDYNFSWKIGKALSSQSRETRDTINLILG